MSESNVDRSIATSLLSDTLGLSSQSKDWKNHVSAITFNCLAPINLDDVDCKLIANKSQLTWNKFLLDDLQQSLKALINKDF
ncbi:MAG TPA: hypothetical protein DCS91_02175 [Microcoleaceae bacterium UBA11344]|jgi:hypothetical protein|nr:hypothetical protein [Microcoleaceae cyanobacterium UBA11344]